MNEENGRTGATSDKEFEDKSGHSPQNEEPAIQSSQGQCSVRRAAISQGAAGSNADPTLRSNNAISGLEQEEDVAGLLGSDDDGAPQGVVVEEGEPQQDGFEEAVQGPPEMP